MKINFYFTILVTVLFLVLLTTAGCSATSRTLAEGVNGKNLDLEGYLWYAKIETNNPSTMMPQGTGALGRFNYKSRVVGIPADHRVPTTGNFKAVRTTSIFGTTEEIIEYDFTAGSDADAKTALEILEKKRAEAQEKFDKQAQEEAAKE